MKKLKVLLVGNYEPDKQESMLRFTNLLVEALKPFDHEVKVIRPAVIFNRSQSSYEEKGKWWGYVDKFLIFPFQLKIASRWADIIHICDHSNAYYIHFVQNKPHVITCHDVIAIRAALNDYNLTVKRTGKILQKKILQGLKKAAHFACVSNNTRNELLNIAGVDSKKVVVVYNSINYNFEKMNDYEAKLNLVSILEDNLKEVLSNKFILHVGGNQFYKNRIGVLRIYHRFTLTENQLTIPKLVLAGNRPIDDEMRSYIAKNELQDSVIEVMNCSNEQIQALYSLARAFIFPSLAEGFGWPVIEAQACGCPVLTSNFAPLTEIGGDAAIYCDPRDETECAIQLKALLEESESARNARVQSGLENVQRFTPQKMIEGYLELYQTAIETYHSKAR